MAGFSNTTNVVSIDMPYTVSKKIVNIEYGNVNQWNQVKVGYFHLSTPYFS